MTAQGTEARRGETAGLDAKRDGPVGAADASNSLAQQDIPMTNTTEQQAVTVAQEAMYLIRKGGYFYRPNAQGYTTSKAEAGRYTLTEAISHSHPNGFDGPRDGMDYILADEPASPRLASVSSASAETSALDWRKIAKAAGEHGVRYRTNTALERFLSDISASPEPVPATNQAGEVECREALAALVTAAAEYQEAAQQHISDTRYDEDGNLAARDAELSVVALPRARAALATQPATSQEGEKPNRWYADAPKNIWLHGIGGGHETTWADDPSPTGDAEEEAHAVGYVRDDLAATPTPPTLLEDLREALLWIADRCGMLVGDEADGWEDMVKLENHARAALARAQEPSA